MTEICLNIFILYRIYFNLCIDQLIDTPESVPGTIQYWAMSSRKQWFAPDLVWSHASSFPKITTCTCSLKVFKISLGHIPHFKHFYNSEESLKLFRFTHVSTSWVNLSTSIICKETTGCDLNSSLTHDPLTSGLIGKHLNH